MPTETQLSCRCGQTRLSLAGNPIINPECLCNSCRQAGAYLQSRPKAPRLLDNKEATRFVVYRKDRVNCVSGADNLREYRLTPQSKTRRVVAACCNSPMFLEFTQGHWLSLYGYLWPADSLPPLDLRTMVGDLADAGRSLPDDVANNRSHSLRFFAALIGAWLKMGFRTPAIDYVQGVLDAPR